MLMINEHNGFTYLGIAQTDSTRKTGLSIGDHSHRQVMRKLSVAQPKEWGKRVCG
jgi:hypothetical protein